MIRCSFLLLFFLLGFCSILQAEQTNIALPAQQQQHPTMQIGQPDSDGTTELLDIKEPIEITDNTKAVVFTAAGILAAALVITLIILWWKRSRKQKAILAHETALQQLLRARQLIDEHNVNAFITLIDQTLRSYIEQRFAVSARRQTTREFISRLTKDKEPVPEILSKNRENLKTWLEHCDLVKFARANLTSEAMGEMLANLHSFIESTRMEPEK